MVNYNSVGSSGDYINYAGRNATIDNKARSYVYPIISIRFGKLTKFWR
jgi:hypothetical protein